MLGFGTYVKEKDDILNKDYLNKVRILFISVLVAVIMNAGIVALLNSIILSKPQNPAPLFSVSSPLLWGDPLPLPRSIIADHSKLSIISSYTVTLHTTFDPFPVPPNPGKLERPLDHEHSEGVSCLICKVPWLSGIGL